VDALHQRVGGEGEPAREYGAVVARTYPHLVLWQGALCDEDLDYALFSVGRRRFQFGSRERTLPSC